MRGHRGRGASKADPGKRATGPNCPRGLTHEHWEGGLKAYARLKAQDTSFMGRMFTLRDLREVD